MATRVFVVGGRRQSLHNLWSGSGGYTELLNNLDERRDRVLSKLDLSKIHNRDDYYKQLLQISYGDKRMDNAFRNWAILNYGNAREVFFERHILPKIQLRLRFEPFKLKSGKTIRASKVDKKSYIIKVHYISRSGRPIEYLQRRELATGRIMSLKSLFGEPIPR